MKVDDCYQIGHVIKTHGLKGEVQLLLDVDDPLAYQELESMFVYQNNTLVPFFLDYIQVNSKKAIAKFEEIEDIEEAKGLVACKIYLPLQALPELSGDEYYFHQLVGMELYDHGKLLGKVDQLFELGPQDLISVLYQGKEILIPTSEGVIKKVDLKNGRVEAELPEGLLDIYLEEDEN